MNREGDSRLCRAACALFALLLLPQPSGAEPAFIVRDIHPGPSPNPANLTAAPDGGVFFTTRVESSVDRLWYSGGTAETTRLLAELDELNATFSGFATAGRRLFFAHNGYFSGFTLWQSDGTPGGTAPVRTFPR